MDLTRAYFAFVRSMEVGNFSAVAKEMGLSQSAVSKNIVGLEKSLGLQLFTRTTRKLHPTNEAVHLYEHIRQLLDTVDSLKSAGEKSQKPKPTGQLRIAMPHSFGRHRVMPLLTRFIESYPEVTLDVVLTDETLDLVEEGLELGIRVGALPTSTLIARSIGIIEYSVVAGAGYIRQKGLPESPVDLARHQCITFGKVTRWEFESENGRQAVNVAGALRVNDADAIFDAVNANLGIAQLPDWLVRAGLDQGSLIHVLPEFYPIPQPVNITYPQTRFLSQRARCFIDFVVKELARR